MAPTTEAGRRISFLVNSKAIAMDNDDLRFRKARYAGALVLASVFLSINALHFQPLALWIRITVPVILSIGLLGIIIKNTLLRVFGWLGIVLFFIVASAPSLAGEEYVLGHYTGGPPEVGTSNILIRLFI